jgi:GT2 family glycosyltransferase
MARIGVVVMDLDQHMLTARCLRSLAVGNHRPDVVVLIENGKEAFDITSDSDIAGLPTVVLHPGRNLGCAGGRNLGLNYLARNTDVGTLVVLDNDTVVPPDFLQRVAARPPEPLDVVAPVVFDLTSGAIWSSGGIVDASGGVRQLSDLPGEAAVSRVVNWAPGACLVMHPDTWVSVGEFDLWLDFLFEDIEWCQRVDRVGGRVLVWPELCLQHEPHQSLGGRWSPQRVRYWARNGTVFKISVTRAGPRAIARWLASETLLAARDLLKGRMAWSTARAIGLVEGLRESRRRRLLQFMQDP